MHTCAMYIYIHILVRCLNFHSSRCPINRPPAPWLAVADDGRHEAWKKRDKISIGWAPQTSVSAPTGMTGATVRAYIVYWHNGARLQQRVCGFLASVATFRVSLHTLGSIGGVTRFAVSSSDTVSFMYNVRVPRAHVAHCSPDGYTCICVRVGRNYPSAAAIRPEMWKK